ncbi:MAG: magnesium chelatase, partial [Bacteroidetes bacterium]|nr:magnesium chelatase [Bacteroidota bacterium]
IELVYEGEQEGPYQVAMNLLEKAIRSQFVQYFPNPEALKKRIKTKGDNDKTDNPYRSITSWFDKGNNLNIFFNTSDKDKIMLLYKVDGLHSLVKKHFPQANEMENALLMEFVLHGLSSHSLISKKILETKVEFKDLIGSMMNLGNKNYEEEFDEEG